ncbi:MAG TPA: efflux RND transporter permease subunit [Saprospiraceae bacterium]|nr:efflux RND transporter permease subunit [Saprospiraceae bacterium]
MKDFKLTSWSIDNRTTIFVITILIVFAGILSYKAIPKEQFPDVTVPQIFVTTIYPGASPSDMEQLVTKPIEKQIKGLSGVKKITSYSVQDFSNIIVEFNTDLDVAECKQKVKDGVDKAKRELPTDLLEDPTITEFDISEIPIMSVNVAGDFSLDKLKDYADRIKDQIEEMYEITRVDLIGALEKEVQIDVDKYRLAAADLTFRDIENALAYENATVSAGNIDIGGMTRSVSIRGDFKDVEEIKNIIITSQSGAQLYLKDIADVKMGHEEQESFSRLSTRNVLSLNVIKRTGENLIAASDKIKVIVDDLKATEFPEDLEVSITGDQSRATRVTLHDLINTIIIGFILVTLILMFFMGLTDALFVAFSVPLSMCIAFMVLPSLGYTLNFIVLFAFLLSLGIVVDDAIVVIENTHRIYHDEPQLTIVQAAKKAAGEVFLPVLSGTATTLAPFFPLLFWKGIFGKFMIYLPVTVILTLTASLVVAYVINPVFAVRFMRDPKREGSEVSVSRKRRRRIFAYTLIGLAMLGFYASGNIMMGNFTLTCVVFALLYKYVLSHGVKWFQQKGWPSIQRGYAGFLTWALRHPWTIFLGMTFLLFASCGITLSRQANIILFPKADPNFIYVYMTLPVGTDINVTDSLTRIIENKVIETLGENNPIVESVISNVALGASEDLFDRSTTSNKGKVGVAFVEYGKRKGVNTRDYLDEIRKATRGLIPAAEIVVDQEQGGPPTPKPISVEIRSDDFDQLIDVSRAVKHYLDSLAIPGVEELRSDLIVSKPEISIEIDRERANREGISTVQIGSEFRTAILGREATKFRDGEDEIPVVVRLKADQRSNINAVENLNITFRDMNSGMLRSVPMAAFADVTYTNTFGGIRRKDLQRMVTISSNITAEFQPKQTQVVNAVKAAIAQFPGEEGILVGFAGEDQEMIEAINFLGRSLVISVFIILLILITQFNSLGKTLIIMTEVVFSIIGVLLGLAIFGMDFSVIMMGVGIVALAGIVVRNGILLVEFTDELRARGKPVAESIIEAGRIRMTPVLLTATAAILGLVPLAVGFNIDFASLFETGNPKIYLGGDSVAFWGPLSWTIIFGLGFATFITLIILPVMYLIGYRTKNWWGSKM